MQPRIHITYDIEENGSMIKKSLPFSIGVVGDFVGQTSTSASIPFKERSFIPINKNNLSSIMSQLKPSVKFTIDYQTHAQTISIPVNLTFNSMQDFTPEAIIQQTPILKRLWQLRQKLKQLQVEGITKEYNIENDLIEIQQDYFTTETKHASS